jgi:hypothetical protein
MRSSISRRCERRSRTCTTRRKEAAPVKKTGTAIAALIREYLSDILGAFIPGVYFSFHLFVSMALLLAAIRNSSWQSIVATTENHEAILGHIAPFAVFAFCLFSYIIGSVFCRKDIKEPDMASAELTYYNSTADERLGLDFDVAPDKPAQGDKAPRKTLWASVKQTTGRFIRFFKKDKQDKTKKLLMDYPYLYLRRYLEHRNYKDLADRIPWYGDNEATFKRRSKTFINRLKSRINRYAPGEMTVVEKNEAHIRLMNSLWYAAKSIRNICLIIFPAIIALHTRDNAIAVVKFMFVGGKALTNDFTLFLLFFSLLQLCIAGYIRHSIKQYFHYMRDREIMFILEIADTIERETGIKMFEGLEAL